MNIDSRYVQISVVPTLGYCAAAVHVDTRTFIHYILGLSLVGVSDVVLDVGH